MSEDTTTPLDKDAGTAILTDDALDETLYDEHQSIPEATRQSVLERDGHRCQIKGCRGKAANGTARLLVQRLVDNPAHCGHDDPDNLETRCLRCCRWVCRMPGRDDLEPILQDRLNGVDIEPTWAEILEFLGEKGPAQTGDILDAVSVESTETVRKALYRLMALDERESVDGRLVVKNRVDGTYGHPWQVPDDHRARGVIPLRPANRRIRILDGVVRRLYEHLPDDVEDPSQLVADVVDRDPDRAAKMHWRADAFQFPFEDWADPDRPWHGATAVIEAVDVLAGATDNVSRNLISRVLADLLENNDEQDLAEVLQDSVNDGRLLDRQLGLADGETSQASDQDQSVQSRPDSSDEGGQPADQSEDSESAAGTQPGTSQLHVFDARTQHERAEGDGERTTDQSGRIDGAGGDADS